MQTLSLVPGVGISRATEAVELMPAVGSLSRTSYSVWAWWGQQGDPLGRVLQ